MKNFKGCFFIYILFLFVSRGVIAQGSGYYIRNYLPKEYKGFNQMWQATQDKNGLMYFAGTSNVFILSGTRWEAVTVKPGSAIRQIVIDPADGTIYTGAAGELGYLERNAAGKFHFISMLAQLKENEKNFNDLWKIIPFNGGVYFQCSERIFIVKNKKITGVIEAPANKGFALAFGSGDHLYVRQRTVGLMEIKGAQLALIPGGELFADKRILGILPFSADENLVLTGDEGFYKMQLRSSADGKKAAPVFFKSDKFLAGSGVLGCKWVNDSIFIVFSRNGIGFYNRAVYLKEIMNKQTGLSDESVAEAFVDREKGVWFMHNNGISYVAYNNSVITYSDKIGYRGTPEIIKEYNNELYLGTSVGLYKIVKQDSAAARHIKALPMQISNTEIWDLYTKNNDLYVATSNGVMRIRDGKLQMLTDALANRVTPMPGLDKVLAAEKGGIAVIGAEATPSIKRYTVEGEEFIRIGNVSQCTDKSGMFEVWASTRDKRLFHLKFGSSPDTLIVKSYDSINGFARIENFFVNIGDSTFFCNNSKCYRYLPAKDNSPSAVCFAAAPDIFNGLMEGTVKNIKDPFDFRFALQTETSPYSTCFGYDKNGTLISRKVMFGSLFSESSLACTFIDKDGLLWALSNDFIATFDTQKQTTASGIAYNCLIRKVSIGNDSVVFAGSELKDIKSAIPFRYSTNSIAFSFDAPEFKLYNTISFYCRLDGYDTTWSKASAQTEKYYTNLNEGTYTFRVKSLDSYGNISAEGTYTFKILPPWYRSYLAYFGYIVVLIGVVFMLVRISATRLRKQKEKLEQLVKERTAEVVEQKQMLETAYEEIQDSIHYAKRIQTALLASDKLLSDYLKEYFIFYKPKDIVSGDFYWAQPKEDWLYMITADCTGHGVPGAFMSLLNISFLNEAINLSAFVKPDEILGYVRTQIIGALKSDGSEEGGKDGMDCVLCAYNFKTKTLLASLSYNPILIVRNKEIIEIKPDKFPVGKHDKDHQSFTLHEIQLQENDVVYTFTDGYPDQFGGLAGKKFKHKQLKQLLVDLVHLPMDEQKAVIEKTLSKWKGKLDQVDDILVIGLRV